MSLVSRFRPGLKAEIGVFFPMIVLRVLENVAQPNFQQKMIVLRFLEKLCVDSQILVDIFVNYDCDVHSPNIFERYFLSNVQYASFFNFLLSIGYRKIAVNHSYCSESNIAVSSFLIVCSSLDFTALYISITHCRMVNGLLKTAQGPPPGVPTTLVPPQDANMKIEAMKCLVAILKSMGDWMNRQLRIPDVQSPKSSESFVNNDKGGTDVFMANYNGEVAADGLDSHSESASGSESANGITEAASLEQRRAYKLELQVN